MALPACGKSFGMFGVPYHICMAGITRLVDIRLSTDITKGIVTLVTFNPTQTMGTVKPLAVYFRGRILMTI